MKGKLSPFESVVLMMLTMLVKMVGKMFIVAFVKKVDRKALEKIDQDCFEICEKVIHWVDTEGEKS